MIYSWIEKISFLILLEFCCIATVVTAADKAKEKDADIIKLTVADNDKTIKAVAGNKLEIRLKGNPTTGFSWRMAELKGGAVKTDGKETYIPDKNDPPRAGSGGTFVFKFTAIKSGKANVKLEYVRPWEKDKPPAEKFNANIIVAEK